MRRSQQTCHTLAVRLWRLVPIALVAATAVACSSTGSGGASHSPSPPPNSSVPISSQPPSISPDQAAATAATAAYLKYEGLSHDAERAPNRDFHGRMALVGVDPALGQFEKDLVTLATSSIAYRGTPPTPRIRISKVELSAKSPPAVTLTDCPDGQTRWVAFYVRSGKPVQILTTGVAPPYKVTVVVVRHQDRWQVSQTAVDRNRTCRR